MTLLRGPVRRRPQRQASRSSFVGASERSAPAHRRRGASSGTGLRVSQLRPAIPHQSAVTGIRSSTVVEEKSRRVLGSNHRVAATVSPGPASPRSSEYQWAIDALQAMRLRAFIRRGEGNCDNARRAAGDRPRLLGGGSAEDGCEHGENQKRPPCVVT